MLTPFGLRIGEQDDIPLRIDGDAVERGDDAAIEERAGGREGLEAATLPEQSGLPSIGEAGESGGIVAGRGHAGGNLDDGPGSGGVAGYDGPELVGGTPQDTDRDVCRESGEGRTEVGCGGDGHAAFGEAGDRAVGRHQGDGGEVAVPLEGHAGEDFAVGIQGKGRELAVVALWTDTSAGSSEMEPGKTL